MLRGLTTSLEVPTIRPSLLSADGTAALVRARLGDASADVAGACHEATGGNPLLIKELLAELDPAAPGAGAATISPDRVATMGPERIAAEVLDRALKVDATGPAMVRAVAVLGEGSDLATVAALAEADPDAAVAIVDRLAAASILTATAAGLGFVHPLLRSSVCEDIPAATRARSHARAAELLRARGAEAEAVAAHLLLCEPGIVPDAAAILEAAAAKAAARGAPESAASYLRRALPELRERAVLFARGDRAGAVEVLRTVGSIYGAADAGPRMTRWRSRLALALPEESREEALGLAREEQELSRALGEPRAEGVALRALGLVEGGKEGIGRLRESVAALRDARVPLELARSLAELGAALRRANRRSEARAELRDAADLAQRCGAEALEERILEEMRIAGAKPRRRAISGSDSLTPGEQRVARAAAAGASNREIAQELFVSLRTVEMHLTNTYRKLGIASRAELVGAMAEASPT